MRRDAEAIAGDGCGDGGKFRQEVDHRRDAVESHRHHPAADYLGQSAVALPRVAEVLRQRADVVDDCQHEAAEAYRAELRAERVPEPRRDGLALLVEADRRVVPLHEGGAAREKPDLENHVESPGDAKHAEGNERESPVVRLPLAAVHRLPVAVMHVPSDAWLDT